MSDKIVHFLKILNESLNFEKVDLSENYVCVPHKKFPIALIIDPEDGCFLSDHRGSGCQLDGIYDLDEYLHIVEILKKCESSAQGDVNQYIMTWAEAVPRVTSKSLNLTRKYLEQVRKDEERQQRQSLKLRKEMENLIKLAEEGNEAAQYNLYIRYSAGDLEGILNQEQAEAWLLKAAKASGRIGQLAQALAKKNRL
jgi:hypothetical protein